MTGAPAGCVADLAPAAPKAAAAPNVLLITLDQFRADCLSAAGHPVVRTPNLDRLAANGVRFARHFSQAAPCAPGRASLYTGTYQFNHRVVANGTPLDRRFDNVFAAAARAGRHPVVFGYTDQSVDPRQATGPDDPRLSNYSPGSLPGADLLLGLPDDHEPWVAWLAELGYDTSAGAQALLASEHDRPDTHSVSAFLTDRAVAWLDEHSGPSAKPWFVHLSYLRPHPPFSAAGGWADRHLTADLGAPIPLVADPDPFHRLALANVDAAAPTDPRARHAMRAHYYGMIEHVDDQLGRLWAALERLDAWDDTLIVLTADHAELLGDHGLQGKLGYWEQSYAIPCIVRDPRRPAAHGNVVARFTENVDVMPTICAAIGVDVPPQCDGRALTAFLDGDDPDDWRQAAHWEFDWRFLSLLAGADGWPANRKLARQHLAALRTVRHLYVQFGSGEALCFDLGVDPSGCTTTTDPAVQLALAKEMLVWRSEHTDRVLADMLCEDGGIGRWPPLPEGWPAVGGHG